MGDKDMTGEIPGQVPEGVVNQDLDQAHPQPTHLITPDELMTSHRLIRLPDLLNRKDIRERRAQEADGKFIADVDRVTVLRDISAGIITTSIDENTSPMPDFPDPENLKTTYSQKNDQEKERLRKGVRRFTETSIRHTMSDLSHDIRILYEDAGHTLEGAANKTGELVSATVNGKTRSIDQISNTQQVEHVKRVYDARAKLLRKNFETYLSFLRSTEAYTGEEDPEIERFVDSFHAVDEEEQARISARVRRDAVISMEEVANANIDRLERIEHDEESEHLAPTIREEYHSASLPKKGKIIEQVIERKTDLSLPYLADIRHLRETLQQHALVDIVIQIPSDDMSTGEQITAEAFIIEELIRIRLLPNVNSGFGTPLGEITTEEMQKEIRRVGEKQGDSSLVPAFQKVALLRTTPGEVLEL